MSIRTHSLWWREVRRAVLVLGLALLLGVLFSNVQLCLVLGFALHFALQLRQAYRFHRWYQFGRYDNPPELSGVWAELVNFTYQTYQKSQKRKRRIQKLIKELSSFRKALPDATVLLNKRDEIVWCNKAAARYLGLNRSQDAGRKITNLIRLPEFVEYLNSGAFDEPLQMSAPGRDHLHLHIRVARYGSGSKVLSARDVTLLYRLERMRRDFVGNVSHELRTPLTVIRGYTEILSDDESLGPERQAIMTRIHEQSERMQNLVDDLLILNRLETTAPAADSQQTIDVPALTEALASEALLLPKAAALDIEFDVSTDVGLIGDPNEIRSAFFNLVTNAVRYTRDGDYIILKWSCDGDGACFEVQDTGIGIAPEHLPMLTQRFYRVQEDRSRDSGGTGLGLAIVKHILERHDGHLDVESELGEGSRFICRFPPDRVSHPDRGATNDSAALAQNNVVALHR